MLKLNYFAAAAALTLVSGVNAGGYPVNLVGRNEEPPAPSCTNFTPFKYSGCFQDLSDPRALLYTGPTSATDMTVEVCVAFCKGMLTTQLMRAISNDAQETATSMLAWSTTDNVSVVPQSMVLK
jgi:hypothetical protein